MKFIEITISGDFENNNVKYLIYLYKEKHDIIYQNFIEKDFFENGLQYEDKNKIYPICGYYELSDKLFNMINSNDIEISLLGFNTFCNQIMEKRNKNEIIEL